MNFRTELSIPISENSISHHSKVVLLGSCFSENMYQKFKYFKFDTTVNPFGIIFNSFSIKNIVQRTIHQRFFTAEDILFHNEIYQSYQVHSSLNKLSLPAYLDGINSRLKSFKETLETATHLFITLGTSWVYVLKENNEIVANCHKVAQYQFEKKLLTIDENYHYLKELIVDLHRLNPDLQITFTVSPVRHIKDGMVENQVSKSQLLSAVYQLQQSMDKLHYFPSYELVLDDLRDYRFYESDLIHPNQIAVDYIWEKFSSTYFSDETRELCSKIDQVNKGLAHRPFNHQTLSHHKFQTSLETKIKEIQKLFPKITF